MIDEGLNQAALGCGFFMTLSLLSILFALYALLVLKRGETPDAVNEGHLFANKLLSTGIQQTPNQDFGDIAVAVKREFYMLAGMSFFIVFSAGAYAPIISWLLFRFVGPLKGLLISTAVVCLLLSQLYRLYKKSKYYALSVLSRGQLLDWDAEGSLFGISIKVRFDNEPHRTSLALKKSDRISADTHVFRYKHLVAKPDLVQNTINGWIVLEYKSLSGSGSVPLSKSDWLNRVRLSDLLQVILAAYATSSSMNVWVACLLKYPGATIMVKPIAEHLTWLMSAGYEYCKQKGVSDVSASDLSEYAERKFSDAFSEHKLMGIKMHSEIANSDNLIV
jgi:hypothetical protein